MPLSLRGEAMRRRSRAGGEIVKARRRKTVARKSRVTSKAADPSSSSASGEKTKVARLTRERDEALQRQTATATENARLRNELTESLQQQTAASDVLQVISSSPRELEPVFTTMLEKAVRICDAKFGNIYRWDGDALHLVASHNVPPAFADARRRSPRRPSPEAPTGRMIATKMVVHTTNLAAEQTYIGRDPDTVTSVEVGGVRSLLSVPMLKIAFGDRGRVVAARPADGRTDLSAYNPPCAHSSPTTSDSNRQARD
jgi:hypothetical protein